MEIQYYESSTIHNNWYQSRPILGRFRALEEKQLAFKKKVQSDICQARFENSEMSRKIDELKKMVGELVKSTRANEGEEAVESEAHQLFDKIAEPKSETIMNVNSSTNLPRIPEPVTPFRVPLTNVQSGNCRCVKADFPKFNSNFPRTWLRRCHRYFAINPMSEEDKVFVASAHLDGKVKGWYSDYREGHENVGWEAFSKMVLEKCLVVDTISESVVIGRLELNEGVVEDELPVENDLIKEHTVLDGRTKRRAEILLEKDGKGSLSKGCMLFCRVAAGWDVPLPNLEDEALCAISRVNINNPRKCVKLCCAMAVKSHCPILCPPPEPPPLLHYSISLRNLVARLLISANLLKMDENDTKMENCIWQSIDNTRDPFLSGMNLGWNFGTGKEHYLSSWKSNDNTAARELMFHLDSTSHAHLLIKRSLVIQNRVEQWNAIHFSGPPNLRGDTCYKLTFEIDDVPGKHMLDEVVVEIKNSYNVFIHKELFIDELVVVIEHHMLAEMLKPKPKSFVGEEIRGCLGDRWQVIYLGDHGGKVWNESLTNLEYAYVIYLKNIVPANIMPPEPPPLHCEREFQYSTSTSIKITKVIMKISNLFVHVENIKEELLEDKQAYWNLDFMKEKCGYDLLENAENWNVSWSRFYGTQPPLWIGDNCNEIMIVVSFGKLIKLADAKMIVSLCQELDHKHCPDISVLQLVKKVFDCWSESGDIPHAYTHYPKRNGDLIKHKFDGHLVEECSLNMAVATNQSTEIGFEHEDYKVEINEEVAAESSNFEEDSIMINPEDSLMIGDEKTSTDNYFDSYSHFGIISFLCAQVGAKHVYVMEKSNMADRVHEIAKKNGFANVITVPWGKIEEIELPVDKIDVVFKVANERFLEYKWILAAHFPVFGSSHSGLQDVVISDVESRKFKSMLLFIYNGIFPEEEEETVADSCSLMLLMFIESFTGRILTTSNRFDLRRLEEICQSHLLERVSLESTAYLFYITHLYHATRHIAGCRRFLFAAENVHALREFGGFEIDMILWLIIIVAVVILERRPRTNMVVDNNNMYLSRLRPPPEPPPWPHSPLAVEIRTSPKFQLKLS